MVSDKRVFPTKDNSWVSLARKPMIGDDKELEKIFKPDKQVCLLNLPPAEKRTAPRSKAGTLLLLNCVAYVRKSFKRENEESQCRCINAYQVIQ